MIVLWTGVATAIWTLLCLAVGVLIVRKIISFEKGGGIIIVSPFLPLTSWMLIDRLL